MVTKKRRSKNLIEIDAIIVAYAMSRLDTDFLDHFSFKSWKVAFEKTGEQFNRPPTSMKLLRDEFDPFHPNPRRGWHQRQMRDNRQRVLGQFYASSDQAVIEIVSGILNRDRRIEELITQPLAQAPDRVENVAERLRTGRLAEEFFVKNSLQICGIEPVLLLDFRLDACGFDFGVTDRETAIEIKGLKLTRGDVLFTDNEWRQANQREHEYWLVVVGNLAKKPRAKLFQNPAASLLVKTQFHQQTTISWRATVAVR